MSAVMEYEACRDELMQCRDLMGSKEFWLGDERRIQNVAKALWLVYSEAPPELKQIAQGTVQEFATRRTYAIGLRQRHGLSNAFDASYFQEPALRAEGKKGGE